VSLHYPRNHSACQLYFLRALGALISRGRETPHNRGGRRLGTGLNLVNKSTSFFDNYPPGNKPTLSWTSVRGRCNRGWPGRPTGKNNKPNQQAAGRRSSTIESALYQRVRSPFPTSPMSSSAHPDQAYYPPSQWCPTVSKTKRA